MSDYLQQHFENTVLHIQDVLLARVPAVFRRKLRPDEVSVIARGFAEGARMAAAEVTQ